MDQGFYIELNIEIQRARISEYPHLPQFADRGGRVSCHMYATAVNPKALLSRPTGCPSVASCIPYVNYVPPRRELTVKMVSEKKTAVAWIEHSKKIFPDDTDRYGIVHEPAWREYRFAVLYVDIFRREWVDVEVFPVGAGRLSVPWIKVPSSGSMCKGHFPVEVSYRCH